MKKKNTNLETVAKEYLKKNPSIKRALKIFNMSQEVYENAIKALSNQKVTISTKTTILNNNG